MYSVQRVHFLPETMGGPQVKGQRPEHSEAGVGAGLRIGRNAAWIVNVERR